MCGIAGFFGKKKIHNSKIVQTLKIMKNRGPDFSNHIQEKCNDNQFITLLHSRLSIIDINFRSNQPFDDGNNVIIFNGEIYNYIELKKKLVDLGEKFNTDSDTEVLLKYYKIYGENCVKYFEGMWSFAIFNKKENKLFLSRDRFAEKPLYYYRDKDGIFFASEIKFLKKLTGKKFNLNLDHLKNFIALGYKSIFKQNTTYFENVSYLKGSESLYCDSKLNIKIEKYWKPLIKKNKKISIEECIEESKRLLIESLKLRIRADVPIAVCLSGGVDSSALASLLVKHFNYKTKTFSIIDEDKRYDESTNIKLILSDLKCENISINLDKKNFFDNLKKQIFYHDAPVATISYHVHSLLANSINDNGFKVAISGTAADELYTGYYDHYLQHLHSCRDLDSFNENLNAWETHVKNNIRNSNFKSPNLYTINPNNRDHIFDGRKEIQNFLVNESKLSFFEEHYDKDILTNRRLNELFYEITPLILNQEDLNCMQYSVENRSPFLDTNLFNFIFSIPNEFLIKNGFSKYILRESLSGILNNTVRLDRKKKGFNASINTLVDFKDKDTVEYLMNDKSQIFELIDRKKIQNLFKKDETPNHLSKFLFSFISSKIFLDQNNNLE